MMGNINPDSYIRFPSWWGKDLTFKANKDVRNDIGSCRSSALESRREKKVAYNCAYKYDSDDGEYHDSPALF